MSAERAAVRVANRLRDGHARIYTRSDGWYNIPLDQYGVVRDTWMAGKAWIEVPEFHGGMLTVKLAEVEAVRQVTADSFLAIAADVRAEREEEMLHGGD